jgi:anaerobic C4-dicarboxylate transporter
VAKLVKFKGNDLERARSIQAGLHETQAQAQRSTEELEIVGLQLSIAAPLLIAMFPAVNGYFFLPTYATMVAAIQLDSTGTTRVGR